MSPTYTLEPLQIARAGYEWENAVCSTARGALGNRDRKSKALHTVLGQGGILRHKQKKLSYEAGQHIRIILISGLRQLSVSPPVQRTLFLLRSLVIKVNTSNYQGIFFKLCR